MLGFKKFIIFVLLSFSGHVWTMEKNPREFFCGVKPEAVLKVSATYLYWQMKDQPLNTPLVTSASYEDTIPGAIGQPHTQVLWGNGNIKIGHQHGFLINAILPYKRQLEFESSYFFLPKSSKKQSLMTSGEPGSANFAVPVFDTTGFWGLNGIPGETVFLLPGPLFGGPGFSAQFHLKVSSQFQGAELNSSLTFLNNQNDFRLVALGGFRWLQLEESLYFTAKSETVPDFPFGEGHYNFKDSFKTMNNFYGAQLGLKGQYNRGLWFGSGFLKGGLGVVSKKISIHGKSNTLGGNLFYEVDGAAMKLDGGVFAQRSNQGVHEHNHFAGIFETSVCGGFNLNSFIKIFVGYDFLFIGNVSRPGKQINRKINPTRTALASVSRETAGTTIGPIPFGMSAGAEAPQGKKEPQAYSKSSHFWAQGLMAGLSIDF